MLTGLYSMHSMHPRELRMEWEREEEEVLKKLLPKVYSCNNSFTPIDQPVDTNKYSCSIGRNDSVTKISHQQVDTNI